ncbi:MAG: hypothetical protein H6550_15895 [Chitinophagales bacterium]|nr:hypothetical protein [Chitinophagales bacterium]
MATNPTGRPRVDIPVVDYSILYNTYAKGVTGFLGVTERGEPSKVYSINSWAEYQVYLGGLISGNYFPLYCKRALERGAKLRIVPAGKYTNPTDKTTLSGTKAALTITQSTASAAGATTAITASANASADGTVTLTVKRPNAADVVIASAVAITSGDTPTAIAAALESAIDAGTGTHGYSSDDTSAPQLDITAPASLGSWGSNLQLVVTVTGGVTFNSYLVNFSGGNYANTSGAEAVFTAKAKGTGYNKVTVACTHTNDPDYVDLTVSISDSTAPTETYRNVPRLGTSSAMATKVAEIQAASILLSTVEIDSAFVFTTFSTALTGGADGTALVANDYAGDSSQATNMHAFDADVDITKICVPAIVDGTLAKSVADYVDSRGDIMGLHRTPINVPPATVLEYRKGTGAYSHTPINSWANLMFTGGLEVVNPADLTNVEISEIADVAGIIATKDSQLGEHYSFSIDGINTVRGANKVLVNVGTGAYAAQADAYNDNGIIPVIQDATKNIKVQGNATLYTTPSLLQKAEVAELIIYVKRSLRTILPASMWKPNDPQTWREIYRRVTPFIFSLIRNRALWNKEEDVDLWYQGDQNVSSVAEAVVNNSADIDAGKYTARIFLQPKVAVKYIEMPLIIANSSVDFGELREVVSI